MRGYNLALAEAETRRRAHRLVAVKCRLSLAEFVREFWPVIEPSTPLVWGWVMEAICDHVQALVEGKLGKNNLLINVPPGSAKSTIIAVCLPAWIWCQQDDAKFNGSFRLICASGSEPIAIRDSMKCRDVLKSDHYNAVFAPSWKFAPDQDSKGLYRNTLTGFRQAISAGSMITGARGDLILVDDPNGADHGAADRQAIINWWSNAAYNRLNNMQTGKRVIIQQRLHEDDLTGYILSTDAGQWEKLIIRAEYEVGDTYQSAIGWTDPRKEDGELFCPERFPRDVIEAEKRVKGSFGYAGQYQQRPAPADGAIFKKGHLKTYNAEFTPKFKRIIASFDTAFKDKEENDFSVGLVIGDADDGYYLLDRWKDKATYPDLKMRIKAFVARWHPTAVLIEDKASGQSLIQDLKAESKMSIVPIKVDKDKVSRAHVIIPAWESGRIFIDPSMPWVDDFLNQLYVFPKGRHDDDVDAFTQGINYLHLGGGNLGMLDWLRSKAQPIKV